jgi:hypothetical protein
MILKSIEEKTTQIMAKLDVKDQQDHAMVKSDVQRLLREGYSFHETLEYMSTFEEVSPDLDEDVALRLREDVVKRFNLRMKVNLQPR